MNMNSRIRRVRTWKGDRGFTLVELLITIAVIAVLVALIFPISSRAMQSAQSAKCMSNLKQIGVAVNLYCNDHDGIYPRSYGGGSDYYWRTLETYVGPSYTVHKTGIFWCPAVAEAWRKVAANKTLTRTFPNYAMNQEISPAPSGTVARQQNIINPSRKVLFMDGAFNASTSLAVVSPNDYARFGTDFHNGGNNVLFVDGHVQWWKDSKSMFKQPYGSPGAIRGTTDIWHTDT